MSEHDSPLDRVERAHEEQYFRRHNRELIEALRAKMDLEEAVQGIAEQTGIEDHALLVQLAEHGIDQHTMAVLHLVPLIEVAWADGEIQANERDLLLEAAEVYGIVEGPARAKLDEMLAKAPSQELLDASVDFIKTLLAALPDAEAERACTNMATLALKVAEANGGIFGLIAKVEDSEKKVLARIADRLSDEYPDAAQTLLNRL
jgi:tellurite resistance protein